MERAKTQPDKAFEQKYAECTPLQRLLLEGVARGNQLFSAVTRQQIAASLGMEGVIAPATLAGAAKTLESRGILTKAGRGQYQLEDEQFGRWLVGSACAAMTRTGIESQACASTASASLR